MNGDETMCDVNIDIYKQIFDEINQFVMVFDSSQVLYTANKTVLDFFDVTCKDIRGKSAAELPWWNYSEDKVNEIIFRIGHVFSMEITQRFEVKHYDLEGNEHEVDYLLKPIVIDGEVKYIIAMGYNITKMVIDKKALNQRDKQIKAFFEYSDDGYFFFLTPEAAIVDDEISDESILQIYDAQRISTLNKRLKEIVGVDEIDHTNVIDVLGINQDELITIWRTMISDGTYTIESSITNPITQQKVFLRTRFIAIFDEDENFEGNFCTIQNITNQYLYERELNFLANKDTSTGLNNRRHFHKLAEKLIEEVEDIREVTVGMLDIDKFKRVNDTYGHDVGDIVISTVAEIINACDESIISGRYGGEEFIVIGKKSVIEMERLLDAVRKEIQNRRINFGDNSLTVTISAGFSVFEHSEDDLHKIIVQADKALYESKISGRNRVTLYDEEILGRKAFDKLTGLLMKKSMDYKLKQVHKEFRKTNKAYAVFDIRLETLIVSEFAIVDQYIKQTAGLLKGLMRKEDIIGRYENNRFIIIAVTEEVIVKKIEERIVHAMKALSDKFDGLVIAAVNVHMQKDENDINKNIVKEIMDS